MPEAAKDEGPEKASLKERILASLKDPKQYAVLEGEFRRGLKDLQDAVLVAFPDSMKSRDEPATIANPTQQIVTEEMKGKEGRKYSLDEFRALGAERAQGGPTTEKQAEKPHETDREVER